MRGYGSRLRHRWFLVLSLALLSGLLPIFIFGKPASGAGTLPTGFTQARFVGGLVDPTAMAFAPDGALFVAEQRGTLRVVSKDGGLQGTPFLDISSKVSSVGERGLLGVAFDPEFATNNYVYVYYTLADGTNPVHNRVARFTASPPDVNGDVVAVDERTIFELPPLGATNHNGGAIHFGSDGKLYVGVGENAKPAEAQSLNSVLGKMLRINKDGSIPEDNQFYARATGNNRAIWALGLRNPYTFDVQPGAGRIFINDVGESTWEEINDGLKGANYGWPIVEGPVRYQLGRLTGPLFAYRHGSSELTGCAITGGAFYNPQGNTPFPADYEGDYFFADYCVGWIRRFDPTTKAVTGFKSGSNENPVDLKVGQDGDLYFLARGSGSVEKISYTPPPSGAS